MLGGAEAQSSEASDFGRHARASSAKKRPMVSPITDEALERARELLMRDEVVAFPTETVYGLGGNALSGAAIERIYAVKGRPRHNPLIVHVDGLESAQRLAGEWPAVATTLARRFWPGPLTMVVRRGDAVSPLVSAGLSTVALRVPAHPAALRLLAACALPLAAPSANRSLEVSPTTAEHVRRSLPDVPLILDGGACRLGIESTVVDLTTTPPRLLRPGALPLRLLREVLTDLEVPQLPVFLDDETAARPGPGPMKSPGMLGRHYAPRARLVLLPPDAALAQETLLALPGPRGLLCQATEAALAAHCIAVEKLPIDAAGYAADLYAALHRLDDRNVCTIAVAPLPEPRPDSDDGWLAIADRLIRASAPSASEPRRKLESIT
jgi:L-threonylcarbamoyladenylate synthase